MAPVEAWFDRAATFREVSSNSPEHARVPAHHALWICACLGHGDAPTWLLHTGADGGLVWCRVPDHTDVLDLVGARQLVGGHSEPGLVLMWLEGDLPDPFLGDLQQGDLGLLDLIGRALGRR